MWAFLLEPSRKAKNIFPAVGLLTLTTHKLFFRINPCTRYHFLIEKIKFSELLKTWLMWQYLTYFFLNMQTKCFSEISQKASKKKKVKKWINSDLEFLVVKTDVYSWYFVHSSKCQQLITIVQKMKFSIKNFFCKCDQIHSFLRIWSHLLTKSLMENFISCAAKVMLNKLKFQVSLSYY